MFILVGLLGARSTRNFASSGRTLVYREKRFNHGSVHTVKGILMPPLSSFILIFSSKKFDCANPA